MLSEKSLVVVLVATVVVSSVHSLPMWKENFRVSINETGTEFSEDVEIDMIKQQVRVHVPAHNALQETASLHDFKNGHSITCYIRDGYCVLRSGQEGLDYTLSSLKWGLETLQVIYSSSFPL
ncbi:uncharacterized protein LOC106166929 [Lingula anatina]|uniref:Uncharacterized protein LOC106166929 n=1 Tax=Lingula anatina TaxID=7574 RepID=A0A1S3IU30_LINAN|nr:uncharacterized protein LOC106166929 [Lingula anatina]|eukprot:XP_013401044.1 uncharacterized protein LOC106166929 [Lingula anatina]